MKYKALGTPASYHPREIVRRFREYLIRLVRTNSTPHSIALGFAIGTFIHIIPTPGFNLLVGLLLVLLFPSINKLALFGGILFWNPVFTIPIYLVSHKVGAMVLQSSVAVPGTGFLEQVFSSGKNFAVGVFVLALAAAVTSYVIVRIITYVYQKKKAKLMLKRRLRQEEKDRKAAVKDIRNLVSAEDSADRKGFHQNPKSQKRTMVS